MNGLKMSYKAFLFYVSVRYMLRKHNDYCFPFISVKQSWDFTVKLIESTYSDPYLWQCFLGHPSQFLIS